MEVPSKRRRIAVVGGGIMGLSSSMRLAAKLRFDGVDASVDVFAETLSPHNTSDGAAGLWSPPVRGPSGAQIEWAFGTLDWLTQVMRQPSAGSVGVAEFSGIRLTTSDFPEDPIWKDRVVSFSYLKPKEIEKRNFPNEAVGFYCSSMNMQGNRYCTWLTNCLEYFGVKLHEKKVESFDEFVEEYDLVVNCSGLGARALCNDSEVEPLRGQILRMKAPWIKQFLRYESSEQKFYVIPCVDYVVIGGTQQWGNWNRKVDPDDRKMILDSCYRLEPSLKKAPIVGEWVGLRPGRRSGPRVELDTYSSQNGSIQVIHNYGHGSIGLSLHWGCAQEVTQLAYKALGIATGTPFQPFAEDKRILEFIESRV